jgi:hypothetical protein
MSRSLPAHERAMHVAARKPLYEKLHPQTVKPAGPGRGKKKPLSE